MHIPSAFSVNGFLGEANYSLSIFTPEGPGGIRPHLSLEYRHRSGDGPLGIGWGIGGLSEITRCPQTVAQDGEAREVRYDSEDQFCLDGQRLIRIAGTHGADGSEYRTEIDSFKKIQIFAGGNGPREFLVTDRNGIRYSYGHAQNSSLVVGVLYQNWRLYEVRDTYNNSVKFNWEKNDTTGEQRLATVEYGGTNAYRVNFTYVTKPTAHQRSGFLWGAPWADVKRMTTVAVQRYEGGWQTIHNYNLAYLPDADDPHHSLLDTVQQCGPTKCFNASNFEWADGQINLTGFGSATTATKASLTSWASDFTADFNNDGKEDVASPYYVNGGASPTDFGLSIYYAANGTLSAASLYQWGFCNEYRVIEYNGDGRADILCIDNYAPGTQPARLYVKESTTTGWIDRGQVSTAYWDSTANGFKVSVADVNGDGLTDLLRSGDSPTGWVINLNTEGAFGSAMPVGPDADSSLNSLTLGTWVNLDDDAALELVVPRQSGGPNAQDVAVYQFNPTTTQLDRYITLTSLNMAVTVVGALDPVNPLPDINGDGLPDLAYKKAGAFPTVVYTRLNTGNGFGTEQQTNVPNSALSFSRYVDANNDGRDDLLTPVSGNGWAIHYSDGLTFTLGSGGNWPSGTTLILADVTGDGHRDVVYQASPTVWNIHPHLAELEAVTSFWDGRGNWQKPTYATISTMADYVLGTAQPTLYPRRFFGGPLYVVDHYETNTGTDVTAYSYATGVIGASYTMNYSYQGARSDNQGRGFLGFATYVAIDSRTALYGAWKYRQDFPYVGRFDNSWIFQPTNFWGMVTTDPVWNHTQTTGVGGIRYFVFEDSNTTKEYQVGGPSSGLLVRTIVRDPTYETTYGSVDLETITTTPYAGESYTTTVDYTLLNLTGPWCLGLPDAISVTRSGSQTASQTRSVDNLFNGCSLENSTNTSEVAQDDQLKTSFSYDSFGNTKTITRNSANNSAANRKTEFFYDTPGHVGQLPSSTKQYIGGTDYTELYTWDYRFATPASHTAAGGQLTSWQYDELGRVSREDRPDSTYTTWIRGLCVTCIGSADGLYFDYEIPSNGMPVSTYFDSYGRKFAMQNYNLGVAERTWRDHLGRVEELVLPYETGAPVYSVNYDYDLANRLVQEDRPLNESQTSGRLTTWTYDRLKTTVTSPGNPSTQTTQYTNDAFDRITSVTDALNGVSQYTYYAFDQLKTSTDSAGHTTTIVYNNRGDKTSISDPDMGFWQYAYNVFGELRWQKDAKLQEVRSEYDQLGRLDWRSEPEFPGSMSGPEDDGRTDLSYYDSAGTQRGLLWKEVAPDGFQREYVYDTFGRLQQEKTVIDGVDYFTNFAYATAGTAKGALERVTYPTSTSGVRFKVDYEYGTGGLLSKAKDGDSPSTVFYQVTDFDGLFRETQATLGNGVVETRVFDRANLLIKSINSARPSPAMNVQNLAYDWYPSGSLKQRIDNFVSKTDDFTYDALNRLDTQRINGSLVLDLDYTSGGDGNILNKSLVGTYSYGGTSGGPHAVTSITGLQSNTYVYDSNGNMTNRDGDAITWYSHNLPKKANYGADSAEFWYGGTDRARYKQVAVASGTSATMRYVGPHYEVETRGGLTIHRHSVLAGGQAVAQYERRSDNNNAVVYLHRDHQGSVVASTDSSGLRQRWEYEPFGTRWRTTGSSPDDTERGFTDHEHLDPVALVHMNGRVHDPMLGRFISADPLWAPFDVQENRYSYVRNNPLTLTDPSGFQSHPNDLYGSHDSSIEDWLLEVFLAFFRAEAERQTPASTGLPADGVMAGTGTDPTAAPPALAPGDAGTSVFREELWEIRKRELMAANPNADCLGDSCIYHENVAIYIETPEGRTGFGVGPGAIRGVAAEGVRGIVAANGTRITGLVRHGIHRVIGDTAQRAGTRPQAILDALKNPTRKIVEGIDQKGRPFQIFYGTNARVIVNPQTGLIVSTNPLSAAGAF